MNYIISQDLANKILNYLAQQRYVDVHTLIAELSAIQPQSPPDLSDSD